MKQSLSRCLHAALCLCLCAALLAGCARGEAPSSSSAPGASSGAPSQSTPEPYQPEEPQPPEGSQGSQPPEEPQDPQPPEEPQDPQPPEEPQQPEQPQPPGGGSDGAPSPDGSAPGGSGEQKGTPAGGGDYDYASPVPQRDGVDNSYFDDAVFIGNSRTEGFMLYSGLTNAKSLTSVGLMVDTIFTKDTVYVDGEKVPVMDALATMDFGKVYIMLGMNELGWVYGSVYQEYYGRIIDRIREINPDAVIYIQSILPVSAAKSDSDKIYNNSKIQEYNQLLVELAEEKQVYYLDVASAVADETGVLPADAATDGVHLTPEYCKIWLEYLKTHTV